MQKVDRATVRALELTAPGACRSDAQLLYGKLRSGQIFGAFSEQDRESIWSEVLAISKDRLIPSLFSLFEDINYLKRPSDCVKLLVQLSPRDSVSSALENIFSSRDTTPGQCVIQDSEYSFTLRPGNLSDKLELGRRMTWIGAMRNHLGMPLGSNKKKKNQLAKPTATSDEAILFEFATLFN